MERPPLNPPIEEEPNELLLDVEELRSCDERLMLELYDERSAAEEEEERPIDVPSRETRVREPLLFTPEPLSVDPLFDPLTTALLDARRPAPDSYAAARRSLPALRPLLNEVTAERPDELRRFVPAALALLRA